MQCVKHNDISPSPLNTGALKLHFMCPSLIQIKVMLAKANIAALKAIMPVAGRLVWVVAWPT